MSLPLDPVRAALLQRLGVQVYLARPPGDMADTATVPEAAAESARPKARTAPPEGGAESSRAAARTAPRREPAQRHVLVMPAALLARCAGDWTQLSDARLLQRVLLAGGLEPGLVDCVREAAPGQIAIGLGCSVESGLELPPLDRLRSASGKRQAWPVLRRIRAERLA